MIRAARKTAAFLAASLALALGCNGEAHRAAARAAPEPAPARRVVLASFDAVAGERLSRLLEEPGKLPSGGFRQIAERGFFARRSRPPTPSLTAVSHATHVTGALPRITGIVANDFLDPSRPFGTKLSGFDAPIRADTLWQAAHRQGKRVGVILYPGADGKTPERSADWGMDFLNTWLTKPRLQTISSTSWRDSEPVAGSFSPARATTLTLQPSSPAIVLVALDTTDDGRSNYDRVRVQSGGQAPVEVRSGDWFAVEVPGPGRTGAWCKLLRLSPDLSETEIYVGGLNANVAYPEEFRRTLDERVGFWPGKPDATAFGADSPHPEAFFEQADRLAEFLTRATELAAARDDWDLLLVYQPEVDEVSHEFFLTDPRQSGYSAERAARFAGFVDSAYALADRSLAHIVKALTPRDVIFVTSDHGMVPLLTAVYPDEILRQAGFLHVTDDGKIDPSSAAVAITSSGTANVYLNPATAPPGALYAVQKVLSDFRIDGQSPWDRVVRRADAGDLGLDAPESGDLILLALPGISLTTSVTPGRVTGRPADYGGHGYRNGFPELDATFLAAGPGIARERVEEFPSWRIAAWVSRVLGIQPPRDASP